MAREVAQALQLMRRVARHQLCPLLDLSRARPADWPGRVHMVRDLGPDLRDRHLGDVRV
jgi:hypothetical protein